MSIPEVSIVVPVYRSEDNLVELHKQTAAALASVSFELILVNDQSPDGSWEVIRQLAISDSRVKGVNLRKNSGQDAAIMAGLRWARGKRTVIMDDDLQHSPFDIPALCAELDKGFDICFAAFPKKKQAAWKNWGSALNGKIANVMIGKPDDIYLSPFKVINTEVVKEICRYDGPYPYVDGLLLGATASLTQIPIEHHERFKGKSNYNLVRSLRVFFKVATSFSVLPLRVSSFFGFLFAILGFAMSLFYLVEYFVTDKPPAGWTTLVLVNLTLDGAILLAIGMVGEYLGRAYLTINKRPQSVVKEVLNQGEKSS